MHTVQSADGTTIAYDALGAGPALILVGGAQAVAGVLPRARRQTIPGQDHAVDPAALAPVLRDFFAG
jgi:hypothetical protein